MRSMSEMLCKQICQRSTVKGGSCVELKLSLQTSNSSFSRNNGDSSQHLCPQVWTNL